MTAIAACQDSQTVALASDSQITYAHNVKSLNHSKIEHPAPNVYMAGAGMYLPLNIALSDAQDYFEHQDIESEVDVHLLARRMSEAMNEVVGDNQNEYAHFLLISPYGGFFITPNGSAVPINPYLAIGSGGEVAMGVLWGSRNANDSPLSRTQQAVHGACAHDAGSGGEVQSVTLSLANPEE